MAKYRKKPVVVEATQWFRNGDHPEDQSEIIQPKDENEAPFLSEGKVVRRYRNPEMDGDKVCIYCNEKLHNHGWIDTVQGGHIVCPGDFVIKEIGDTKRGYYPCKPDVFEATYELVLPLEELIEPKLTSSGPAQSKSQPIDYSKAAREYGGQIMLLGKEPYEKIPPARYDELMELHRLMNNGKKSELKDRLNALREAHGYLQGLYNEMH